MVSQEKLYNCFAGSALGCFIGDAMGMPVEGWTRKRIVECYGLIDEPLPGRFEAGSYTDDTEMMIGLLEALVRMGRLEPAIAAERFLINFNPERGYGGRIYGIMDRLAADEDWDRVGTDSYGNGAAMRVAPVGFFCFDDLNQVKDSAIQQARITHKHPEALAGAVIQAAAVALAAGANLRGETIDPRSFISTVCGLSRDLDERSAERLAELVTIQPGSVHDVASQIAKLYKCDVRAIESVGPAVASFLYTDDFSSAVIMAVNLGGDADTIGAMAGAIAGAFYGLGAVPDHWLNKLEDERLGKSHVEKLCQRAVEIKHRQLVPNCD